MKLLGHVLIDFTPEGQDKAIKFGKLFLGDPIKENGAGVRVEVSKCTPEFYNNKVKNVPINSDVEVYYDKYQRVSMLNVLNK